jgi:hypothetical protein
VAVDANPAPAAALLARAIPNACVLSFPVVPAPEPPATAKTTPAITTGSDATTIVLRRRRAAGGKSFRGIPSPPMGLFPVRSRRPGSTGAAQRNSFPQIRQTKPVRELPRAFGYRLTNQSAR